MRTTDTTVSAPPFSDWITEFLLAGPRAGAVPRDAVTRAELRRVWGAHGERVAETWRQHEHGLRQAAAARGIRPTWPGRKFFGEAIAQKGTR